MNTPEQRLKSNKKSREWSRANPHRRYLASIKYQYGLNERDWRARMSAQDSRCKICEKLVPLVVDHDHDTGIVRSLLCKHCNQGLGHFRDSMRNLETAVKYLSLWSKPDDR